MSASEHYAVCTLLQEGGEAGTHGLFGFRAFKMAALNELHESAAHLFLYPYVGGEAVLDVEVFAPFQGSCRCEYAYDSGYGAEGGWFNRRFHAYEGDVVLLPQHRDGSGCGGVTCKDHHLNSSFQEEVCDEAETLLYEFRTFLAVRTVGVV